MPVTRLGKFNRVRRIKRDESITDMAQGMGVSTSFLSAIETGRKKISDNHIEKMVEYFGLNEKDAAELRRCAEESQPQVKISLTGMPSEKRNLTMRFARNIGDFDEEAVNKFKQYLEEYIDRDQ